MFEVFNSSYLSYQPDLKLITVILMFLFICLAIEICCIYLVRSVILGVSSVLCQPQDTKNLHNEGHDAAICGVSAKNGMSTVKMSTLFQTGAGKRYMSGRHSKENTGDYSFSFCLWASYSSGDLCSLCIMTKSPLLFFPVSFPSFYQMKKQNPGSTPLITFGVAVCETLSCPALICTATVDLCILSVGFDVWREIELLPAVVLSLKLGSSPAGPAHLPARTTLCPAAGWQALMQDRPTFTARTIVLPHTHTRLFFYSRGDLH